MEAVARIKDGHGGTVLNEVRRRVHQLIRHKGMSFLEAEDMAYGVEFGPEKFPVYRAVVPNIEWEDGRAEVEAAGSDFDWLLAALWVKLPDGVGKPHLLKMLHHIRSNDMALQKFMGESIRKLGAARRGSDEGIDDMTLAEIVGGRGVTMSVP